MTTHNCFAVIKQITGFVGAAGVSVLISLPAWAQPSQPRYQRLVARRTPVSLSLLKQSDNLLKKLLLLINLVHRLLTLLHLEVWLNLVHHRLIAILLKVTIKPGIGSPSTEISPEDLQNLPMLSKVTANSTISSREMAQVIQQQGLSEKRIEEIYQARKNPQQQQ